MAGVCFKDQQIRRIKGKADTISVNHLEVDGSTLTILLDIANSLGHNFSYNSSSNFSSDAFRKVKLQEERKRLTFASKNEEYYNNKFTISELKFSLKQARDTATGPDDIHYQILKHLPYPTLKKLLCIFNQIWDDAPKVKYNIVLTSDGVLKEKKTFKGYSSDKISVEDYVQLASGHDVSNEFNKPWEKSFTNGVVIPNDKQTKVFRSYLNNVKRKPPKSEGIMYPYNDKDEYSFDENYEFDDFDYLSNQEENEDCFK
ncbi:hypothetical protein LOTGIDRAFT_176339 [Lottia gigantea]|uniref:Uncharacterized protein n=1 Tax=Lottia gigantea TaxID=225164 RepID=V4B2W4_LOTGI|nr:hypothetical protein LOTGIDRAFT_176339 [Lottia gigantea]ESP04448.1 hypothetical protein LOTGIDRAFT_176339 [Lottia gigantea]